MREKQYRCETCRFRRYAEKHPDRLLARFWRWHTTWCPGWKAYVKAVGPVTLQPEEMSQEKDG